MVKILGYLGALVFWTVYPLLIVALAPIEAAPRYPCQGAGQHRSKAVVREFMRLTPCPGGKDKGRTDRCRGYEADHVCALSCCGIDAVQNLQWLTKEQNRKKGADCSQCGLKVGE